MLSRKVVTRRGRRFRGYFPSHKLGRMVAWESLLERDAILLLEFSLGVVTYQEQPTVIQYIEDEKQRNYYPDFELVLTDGTLVHLEVKPTSELEKPAVASRFRAIAAHYFHRQQDFRIVTEENIRREPLLSNVQTLAYLAGRPAAHSLNTTILLREFGSSPLPFDAFTEWLGRDVVLQLISASLLTCDLNHPLDSSALLTVVTGDEHASILL